LADRVSSGYMMLIHASGKIKVYMTVLGTFNALRCLFVFLFFWFGVSLIPALWMGWFAPWLLITMARVFFVRQALGSVISIRHYYAAAVMPCVMMIASALAFSFGFKAVFGDSVYAIFICFAANALVVASVFWFTVGAEEQKILLSKIRKAYVRIFP